MAIWLALLTDMVATDHHEMIRDYIDHLWRKTFPEAQ